MREIRFRGKTLKDNRWVSGNGIWIRENYAVIPHQTERGIEDLHVSLETVGQYIGIVDVAGSYIYEGHIVEIDFALVRRKGVIIFKDGYWLCELINSQGFLTDELENCLVIGNIHDNPELLEENEA